MGFGDGSGVRVGAVVALAVAAAAREGVGVADGAAAGDVPVVETRPGAAPQATNNVTSAIARALILLG